MQQPAGDTTQGNATPAPPIEDTPVIGSGYTLSERNKQAMWAILCISASAMSLLLLGGTLPLLREQVRTPGSDRSIGIVTLIMLIGLVGGALLGHILGLWAYSRREVRNGEVPGRDLARVSIVTGVVLMLATTVLSIVAGNTLGTLIGAIG